MKIIFTRVGERMEVTQAELDSFEEVEAFKAWYAGKPVQQELPFEESK
jgi:hypothetical protein